MANDLKLAETFAKYATNSMQGVEAAVKMISALTIYFTKLLENDETKKKLLDFYNIGLGEEAKLAQGESLSILSYSIDPEYAKPFYDICKRDNIGYLAAQSYAMDLVVDGQGDSIETVHNSVWIYNTQQKEFMTAIAEAKAISGYEIEIPRHIANEFARKQEKAHNPMREIKNMPIERYVELRKDIQKLDRDMRFTLFPEYKTDPETGKVTVDVGFFSKTTKLYDRSGNPMDRPVEYDIQEIMKGLMVKMKMMELEDLDTDYFKKKEVIEERKSENIDKLLNEKSEGVKSMTRAIADAKLSKDFSYRLTNMVSHYSKGTVSKAELELFILNNSGEMFEKDRKAMLDVIKNLEQEKFFFPVKMVKENGKMFYELETNQSVCLTDKLYVRDAGKEDIVITDQRSYRSNLNHAIMEMTERGNFTENDYTFVVLTRDELSQIEKGDPTLIGENNRLKLDQINYTKQNRDLFPDEPTEREPREILAEEIIFEINKKKERFMLKSEQEVYNVDRFDDHKEATIETIIAEEDFEVEQIIEFKEEEKEKAEEIKEEMKEICEEVSEMQFEAANRDYIDQQIREAQEELDRRKKRDRGRDRDNDRDNR